MVKTIITVIQVICALAVICVIMLQSGKNAGLSGAIAGAADSFLSKSKASTWDAKLARADCHCIYGADPGSFSDSQ